MGGKASKTTISGREREVYARLPYGGTTDYTEVPHRPSTRATFHVHKKKQSQATNTRSTRAPSSSRSSKHPKSWTPVSPHSTTFTVSTADSAHHPEEDRDSSSSLEYSDKVNPPPVTNIQKPSRRMSDQPHAYGSGNPRQSVQPFTEDQRRIIEAETILGEIAKEYAAKRAAGLVPTKPVPARTLLWEELAKKSMQAGRRGQCVFGRDTDNVCGCTTYKKKRVPGQENPGGVCECCNHGAVWHKLQGGTMARSSRMTRSIIGTSMRASRLESGSYVPSEARSSAYEYDSDEDEDDEWDEDIANEMAMPTNYVPAQPMAPPPALQTEGSSRLDRLSLLSMGSSYGFPSRLSSATNSLGALLQAIQRYRDMGLDEDEIEERIRADFPPVPRKSSVAARSDISTSHVDV